MCRSRVSSADILPQLWPALVKADTSSLFSGYNHLQAIWANEYLLLKGVEITFS